MVLGKVLACGQVTLPGAVRRAAGIQADDVVAFEVTGPGMVEIRRLPRLTMAEAIERYRIDVPVELPADRAGWEAGAAADVLGQESA